jgi:hypothetical protein
MSTAVTRRPPIATYTWGGAGTGFDVCGSAGNIEMVSPLTWITQRHCRVGLSFPCRQRFVT